MRSTVSITMPEEMERRLRTEAARLNQPISWFVRHLLERALDRHGAKRSAASIVAPRKNRNSGTSP